MEERKALEEMKILCHSSLVPKKADKSNTLVIMEKSDDGDKLVLKRHLLTSTYEIAEKEANHDVYKELTKYQTSRLHYSKRTQGDTER